MLSVPCSVEHPRLSCACLGVLALLMLIQATTSSSHGSLDISSFFVNITAANLTDSLYRIQHVPFKLYEYKHDHVVGRRSLGIIGPDAMTWFPESVEVVPQYPLPSKDRSKKTVILQNFPVIDKNVIFMHGVASVQALVSLLSTSRDLLSELQESHHSLFAIVNTLELAMNSSMSEQISEKLRQSELELQIAVKSGEFSGLETEYLQKEAMDKALEVKELLDYESDLVKKRLTQEEALARELMDRKVSLEESMIEKRERMRKETHSQVKSKEAENLAKIDARKAELEKEKIAVEMELRAKSQKEQEELSLKQLELQAKLDTERVIQTVKSVATQIKGLLSDLFANPSQVLLLCSSVVGLMAVYYVFKQLVIAIRSFIQSKIGRPKLVRETSMESALTSIFYSLVSSFRKQETMTESAKHIEEYFKDVILAPEDKSRVLDVARATRNTKASKAPYRHMLLHGPPGTGKTLIARKLAQCSGMDYAILSGGDVGPLGSDAVSELHALFAWAEKSRRGLLVFIDEAEAFLSSRTASGGGGEGSSASSADDVHMRHALNALLYQTGTQSTTFMLVIATNRPQDLDSAVLDRMDMSILIDIPKLRERSQLVKLYMDIHVKTMTLKASKAQKCSVDEDCYSDEFVDSISQRLGGFSGREISKLFISAQYAMMMSTDAKLSKALLTSVVENRLLEHSQRSRFNRSI